MGQEVLGRCLWARALPWSMRRLDCEEAKGAYSFPSWM